MKTLLKLILLILPSTLSAEDIVVGGPWGGLNNYGFSNTYEGGITASDSDALVSRNIEYSDDAMAFRKRPGYAYINGNINVSTHTNFGGASFIDGSGNERVVFTNDTKIIRVWPSAATIVSTDTSGSYYDFEVKNGELWRANSSKDDILKYDGTNVTYYSSIPKGNQIEFLPDRGVISGVASSENCFSFSKAADFTDYTTGLLETDGFQECVGTNADEVISIKTACGGVLVGTSNSLFLWTGTSQFDGVIEKLSEKIGIKSPYTVKEYNGEIYFQGSDNDVYRFNCNQIEKISSKISKITLGLYHASDYRSAFFDSRGRYWLTIGSTGSENSWTLIYAPSNNTWTYYSFPAVGGLSFKPSSSQTFSTWFGGASTGSVNTMTESFGLGLDADDGANFTARFQSKYFLGTSPYIEKRLNTYSILMRQPPSGGSATLTAKYYSNDLGVSAVTDTITIAPVDRLYQRINRRFPSGTKADLVSISLESTGEHEAFEIYGFSINYTPESWRVYP